MDRIPDMAAGLARSIVLGFAILNCGCAVLLVGGAAAAGAGAVAYVRGELKSTESASLEKAWTAAEAAMKELEFAVTKKEKDGVEEASLVARGADDKKIQVHLKSVTAEATEIRIRVGVFGDESLSLDVLDAIRKKLGQGTARRRT